MQATQKFRKQSQAPRCTACGDLMKGHKDTGSAACLITKSKKRRLGPDPRSTTYRPPTSGFDQGNSQYTTPQSILSSNERVSHSTDHRARYAFHSNAAERSLSPLGLDLLVFDNGVGRHPLAPVEQRRPTPAYHAPGKMGFSDNTFIQGPFPTGIVSGGRPIENSHQINSFSAHRFDPGASQRQASAQIPMAMHSSSPRDSIAGRIASGSQVFVKRSLSTADTALFPSKTRYDPISRTISHYQSRG